jgi:hypothetical protein
MTTDGESMKRLLAAAAVLATFTHAAFAGEMTLFSDSNFRGNHVTLQRDTPDLREFGFNDRASSIVIRSGVWQLCQDGGFRGRCIELGPGEYRQLPDFNDAVSSAREIERRGPDRDARRDERRDGYRGGDRGERGDERGDVLLFDGPRFEGAQIALTHDEHALNDIGFNDRAASLIIRTGRWEFCEHADYRGQCIVYGPGRYPFLEQMNNRISSLRRVR